MKYPDIFNPDLSRVGTAESQMYNLVAGELVTHVVRTSLGPRGMMKVYIDILGEETITKHGGAFLRKLDVDHPAAKTVIDGVNSVDNHVGDGTVSTAIVTGALLKEAKQLRIRGVPTAAIIRGFEFGMKAALDGLARIRFHTDRTDRNMMESLVRSCIRGKALGGGFDKVEDSVVQMIVNAMYCVTDLGGRRTDVDAVKIEEKIGNPSETRLVRGTIIDKPTDGPMMRRAVHDARILLINEPLERSRTKTESEVTITAPEMMGEFLRRETDNVTDAVKPILDSGADVVISRKGIDERAHELLCHSGIVSIRRVKYNDLWWLEKSTGASTCNDIHNISEDELGHADCIYERKIDGDRMFFVESHNNPRSVTLLLRASSKRYLDEFHRTALNALYVLRNFVESPHLVFGGGSCEAALAKIVREKGVSVKGREQVAALRFADALEEIPLTLAENLGMDRLDVLPGLRSLHYHAGLTDSKQGGTGSRQGGRTATWYGIDPDTRDVRDMSVGAVLETAIVKEQMIKTATETACMILNVNDLFIKDLIDNTHCHIDGTVHAHKDPGRNHNHWEQEGLEQRQMHHYY